MLAEFGIDSAVAIRGIVFSGTVGFVIAQRLGRKLEFLFLQQRMIDDLTRAQRQLDHHARRFGDLLNEASKVRLSLGADGSRLIYRLQTSLNRSRRYFDQAASFVRSGDQRALDRGDQMLTFNRADLRPGEDAIDNNWSEDLERMRRLLESKVRSARVAAAKAGVPRSLTERAGGVWS